MTVIFVVEKPNWVKERDNNNTKERNYSSGNISNAEPPTKRN